ncbi:MULTISPECIES: hypothetical protein [unclassified Ruegeria]|nr:MULTISPECIES: hypothetical protein [unclassified Ruegeria]
MKRRVILAGMMSASLVPDQIWAAPEGKRRAEGRFTTGSTAGGVSLFQNADQWAVYLEMDFVHDGSPDPWVALGQDGFRRDAIIGELTQFRGAQSFPIGPKLTPIEFNEVYIWCVQHNTSLGRARLTWL